MNRNLRITIPKPCHEGWENMNPADKGRFCASCQKVVMDFTSMSDAQVAAYFKKPTGNTCGRFHNDQLNRDLSVPKKRLPWIKYFFQVAIPALLFSSRAVAQGRVEKQEVSTQLPAQKDVATEPKQEKLRKITGKVMDEKGYGVPFATVMIKGSRIGVQADDNGIFTIEVKNDKPQLEASAVGFVSRSIELENGTCATFVLQAAEYQELLGVVVTVGYAVPSEEKWPFFSSKGLSGDWSKKKYSYAVNGRVLNENGEPLANALVNVHGTKYSEKTDNDGAFSFVPKGNRKYELKVSCEGYVAVIKKLQEDFCGDIVLQKEKMKKVAAPEADRSIQSEETTVRAESKTPGDKRKPALLSWLPKQNFATAFSIYPNPVSSGGKVTIEWKKEEGEYRWELTDVAGRNVARGHVVIANKISIFHIELPPAPPGTYFLTFNGAKRNTWTEKIIIK